MCCSGTLIQSCANFTILPQSSIPKPNFRLTWCPPPLIVQLLSTLGIRVPRTTICCTSRHVKVGLKVHINNNRKVKKVYEPQSNLTHTLKLKCTSLNHCNNNHMYVYIYILSMLICLTCRRTDV